MTQQRTFPENVSTATAEPSQYIVISNGEFMFTTGRICELYRPQGGLAGAPEYKRVAEGPIESMRAMCAKLNGAS